MSDKRSSKSNVRALAPHPGALMDIIKQRAKNRENVKIGKHAFDRKEERSGIVEITLADVYRTLDLGNIDGIPVAGKNPGEWKVTVAFRPKGSRTIGVATVVTANTNELYVTTIMWRDA